MDYLLGFLNFVIVVLTLFLIILILIQRGKGGGLAGAFGGMGGSSAFGARTGDVFTKVTVGVAIAWILLSMLMVVLTNRVPRSEFFDSPSVASKGLGTLKGKSKGASDAASTPKLPGSTAKEVQLPDDMKAVSELPLGPLEGPIIPSKKN